MICRKTVFLIGITLLILAQQGVGATCVGDKVAIPDRETFASIRRLAESGDTTAQVRIGMAYLVGGDTQKDIGKGVYWLTRSANDGNIEGQYLLGRYYVLERKDEESFQEAAKWLRTSANKGCTQSLAYLGILSLAGKGGVKKDERAGYEMLLKSAKAGYPLAQYTVGSLLLTGEGVTKDTKAGFAWVKRAAATGDPVAGVLLATLYLEGTGTKKDPRKSKAILLGLVEKGGEQGPIAAYYLGWMYMEGKGISVDRIKALNFMIIAAQSSVADSETRLKTLVHEAPEQKLASSCSVFRDSKTGAKSAKEYLRAVLGETVIVLRNVGSSLEVYFPNRPLVGFVSRDCLSSMH